jgi:CBS domain-containing protein
MNTGEICTREVVTVAPADSVLTAARIMADRNVGTVFVVTADGDPAGVLTDRDIVVRCVAEERDPQTVDVAELMSTPLETVDEDAGIAEALAIMSDRSVRRLGVTRGQGPLVGVVALDDILDVLAGDLATIGDVLRTGRPSLVAAGE